MGHYGIDDKEFLDGHIHITKNRVTDRYGFEDFLRDFEGDVSADTVAEAWNKLAKKYKWADRLIVREKGDKNERHTE